jgi:transcription elongation factor Elf1
VSRTVDSDMPPDGTEADCTCRGEHCALHNPESKKDPFDWHCQVCGVGFRTKTNTGNTPSHLYGNGPDMCIGSNKPAKEVTPSQKELLAMMDQGTDTVKYNRPCNVCNKDYRVHRGEGHPFDGRILPDRQSFATGAVRDNDKEARYDLVPSEPFRKLAVHYGRGAKKYEERNWEKGIPFMRMYASLMRHTQAWVSGEDIDQDETMQNPEHLVAALWNIVGLIELSQTHPELDDRPKKSRPEKKLAVGCNICGKYPCESPFACASARNS